MEASGASPLTVLDSNLLATVLLHTTPHALAQVAQTCKVLAKESMSEVVWCTLFLRRFGTDFWAEASGRHPYHSVACEPNEWLNLRPIDVFPTFVAQSGVQPDQSRRADSNREEEEEDDGAARLAVLRQRLGQFAVRHANHAGYGGWKQAYRRMHEMASAWSGSLTNAELSFLVAGLPGFGALCTVLNSIRDRLLIYPPDFTQPRVSWTTTSRARCNTDLLSPGGECRVLRMDYDSFLLNGEVKVCSVVFCVVRKPRNWYTFTEEGFRGLSLRRKLGKKEWPRLIYLVDVPKLLEDDDHFQRVYGELHGMLGEAREWAGLMPIQMCLLLNNSSTEDFQFERQVMERLRIPPYNPPNMCPFFGAAVVFRACSFALATDRDHQGEAKYESKALDLLGLTGAEVEGVGWDALHKRDQAIQKGFTWLARVAFPNRSVNRDDRRHLYALRGDV